MDKTDYTYDPLNRLTSQAVNGGTPTSYSYLGLSGELTGEVNSSSGLNKAYSYTPGGQRLAQYTPGTTATNLGYYSYNDHNDVEAVTGSTKATGGATTATYGYTAYGQPDPGQFTGNDKNNVNPSPATQPYNSYRFNAMRWDSGSGQYDMGFRNYAPGLNQFLSRDMYNGALADMQLTTDPFTGNRYTFAAGNPITNIELDGHTQCDAGICPTQRQTQQVTQAAARYGAGCPSTEPGCPGYQTPASGNDGSQCGMFMPDCTNPCVRSPSLCTGLGTQLNDGSQNGIGNKRTWNMLGRVCPAAVAVLICPIAAAASGEGGEGGQPTGGGSGSKLPWFEDLIANALNAAKAAMDERGIFGALKTYRQWLGARAAVRLDLGGNTYVGASGRGIQQIKGTLSMFVGHAEGDAFSQALESGIDYEGQSGTLYVSKMDEPPGPCSMCQSQITNVARRMGIAELTTYTPEGYFGSWDPVNGWDIP